MFGILDVHTDPNTRKLHTNAVYQDKTQLANFQGNLPYPATKRHLTVKRRKTTITRRTDVDACDCTRELCCTDTASESALEADTGRKKSPFLHGDSNPSQYCAWLFSRTLSQLLICLVLSDEAAGVQTET